MSSSMTSHKKIIKDFLELVGIDKCIKKIILTKMKSKSTILNKYNIIRHYDDSLITINEIIRNNPNIEIIKVYPFHGGVFKKYKSKNSFPTLYDILLILFISLIVSKISMQLPPVPRMMIFFCIVYYYVGTTLFITLYIFSTSTPG